MNTILNEIFLSFESVFVIQFGKIQFSNRINAVRKFYIVFELYYTKFKNFDHRILTRCTAGCRD